MDLQNSLIVIRYHFRTAIKYILRFKNHSVYSLIGLVMGLASVFVISAWTIQELRYDRFHPRAKQIYMLTTDVQDNAGNVNRFPETPAPLAAELALQVPQIERAFHFLYLYGGRDIGTEVSSFKEAGIAAPPAFFEVLNFSLLAGSASELEDPNSLFLSRGLADKLFPGTDPINREIIYKEDQVLVVKGIFRNCPVNSSLQFDFVIPYEIEYGISDEWWQLSDATFIRLLPDADPGEVHSLMRNIWRERITDDQFDLGWISVADLRYGADFEYFNAEHGHGDRKKLYMFMGVALLILILACLNYLTLASSYAMKREQEIWIRKVHGAGTGVLRSYFLVESVLISILAWGLAALIAVLGLRLFENLIGIVISAAYFYACTGFGLIASVLLVGFASGFYPAMQAGARALVKTKIQREPGIIFQRNLRQVFVGSQFILSIALTISGLVLFRQAAFMKNFYTGYATRDIVEFKLPVAHDTLLYEAKGWLDARPDIENFSLASTSPVNLTVLNTTEQWRWKGLEEGSHTSIFTIRADEEYLNVFQIPLIRGRFFSPMGTDEDKVVINETLAGQMGFEDPLGQIVSRGDKDYEIIGVVRDFNFQHLSNGIRPLFFTYGGTERRLYVRMHPGAEAVIGKIQEKLSALSGDPVDFSFIDEIHEELYRGESQILAAVLFFTVLCIVLSSLGLIGMVSHSASARTKEIAVRKVFGASSRNIMISQQVHILIMFLPGAIIGNTLAWFIMRRWLENYAYRIGIEGWVFVLGTAIILGFALLSNSFQAWNASKQSPARSLKHL